MFIENIGTDRNLVTVNVTEPTFEGIGLGYSPNGSVLKNESMETDTDSLIETSTPEMMERNRTLTEEIAFNQTKQFKASATDVKVWSAKSGISYPFFRNLKGRWVSGVLTSKMDIGEPRYRESIDYLNDEKRTMARASHGIHLYNSGQIYIFPDYFEQFISVKIIPRSLTNLTKLFESWCTDFSEMVFIQSIDDLEGSIIGRPITRSAVETHSDLSKICNDYTIVYEKLIRDSDLMLEQSVSKFKTEHDLNRRKREVAGFIVGLVVGGVVGGYVGYQYGYSDGEKHSIEKLTPILDQLKAQVGDNFDKIEILNEEMISFTKLVES